MHNHLRAHPHHRPPEHSLEQSSPREPRKRLSIALAGQPNVGKSTVFNILTGLNQHVGNWPGKTVEQRTGTLDHHGLVLDLIDLPGAYSLTCSSPEETVTRDYIIHERPDVVMVVINAACIERNLYLVAELLALPAPIVIGLNMIDVAKQEGFEVNPEVLAAAIGVPVIPMIATKGIGVHELIDAAIDVALHGPSGEPNRPEVREDHRQVLAELESLIKGYVPDPYPQDWVALKLFEGDREVIDMMRLQLPADSWEPVQSILQAHEDAMLAVASGRYEWISRMTRAALKRPRSGQVTLTSRLDRYATHPFWGLLILAAVLGITFYLTYSIGGPLQSWLAENVVGGLARWFAVVLSSAPTWMSGLVVDGLIGGAGLMISFLPILLIFFIVMGILEDVGYMARAAYVVDRFMHVIGLHGKSFLPLFLGFGCNVPAIMGARVIEDKRSRIATIMLAPLVPCAARLGVLTILVPVFFPQHATLVSWLLTGLPLVVLALMGMVLKRIYLKDEDNIFIMEMPLYHVPNARTIALFVWNQLLGFLQKAGTTILAMSIVIWALSTLPSGDIETSYLAQFGRLLEPIGRLMGLGWRPMVALLSSFVAKENAISSMSVLYNVSQDPAMLSQALRADMSTAAGLAYLVAQMLFIPCASTVAVIKQETGSWKWTLLNILFLTLLTLVAGILAYQLGSLIL